MNTKKKILLVLLTLFLAGAGMLLFFNWRSFRIENVEQKLLERLVENTMNRPFEFYGKVVDENGNSVGDANIMFDVLTDPAIPPTFIKSDKNGFFALRGKGSKFGVRVEKDGYYSPTKERLSYTPNPSEAHANLHYAKPDPQNPVVFHLLKKSVGVALITRGENFQITLDGKPVEVDLMTGKAVSSGNGHLKVQFWRIDGADGHYEWRYRVTVLDGGLIEAPEELAFMAPEGGYREFDEVFSVNRKGPWVSHIEKQYFLKLKDGNYAVVTIRAESGGVPPWLSLDYYLNPSGSRNLEYDAEKKINKYD